MKKIFSIVIAAAVFALVGCSAEKTKTTLPKDEFPIQKEKCHSKKCHHHQGKLGVEKNYEDSAK